MRQSGESNSQQNGDIEKYEDITLKGYVEEMKKDSSQKSIVLLTIVNNKPRRVHIELTDDSDYKIANDAHMTDQQIEISGELDTSSPKKWILNLPVGIKIV